MVLPDVNVLIYAHRPDAERHEAFRSWVESLIASGEPYALSDLVLSGVVRIITNPRAFPDPTPVEKALRFVADVRDPPQRVPAVPGPRHWQIFTDLCRQSGARGNLVADAYHAALAIESGCEWITTDRDYARFPGLRWRHPLDSP